jgi:hypothetical protein
MLLPTMTQDTEFPTFTMAGICSREFDGRVGFSGMNGSRPFPAAVFHRSRSCVFCSENIFQGTDCFCQGIGFILLKSPNSEPYSRWASSSLNKKYVPLRESLGVSG